MNRFFINAVLLVAFFVLNACNTYHTYQLIERSPRSKEGFIENSIARPKFVRISNNLKIYYLSKITKDSVTHDLNCTVDSVEDISKINYSSWFEKMNHTNHKPPDKAAFSVGTYLYSEDIRKTDEKNIVVPYQSINYAAKWEFNFLLSFGLLILIMFIMFIAAFLVELSKW